jgi:hypothetical protein
MNDMVEKKVIKGKWIVKIPEGGRIMAAEGKVVDIGDVLVRVEKVTTKSFDVSMIMGKMSKTRVEEWINKWRGKEVKEGEIIYEGEGLFAKKIYAPVTGIIGNIDEFLNINFELRDGEKREIKSPVKAKVAKVEKEKMVLEFKAKEYGGEGLIEGKMWGESGVKISRIGDLNSEMRGKVILVANANLTIILKADVIGVAGIVVEKNIEEVEELETKTPILKVDKSVFEILEDEFGRKPNKQLLINSKMGRLLVVE